LQPPPSDNNIHYKHKYTDNEQQHHLEGSTISEGKVSWRKAWDFRKGNLGNQIPFQTNDQTPTINIKTLNKWCKTTIYLMDLYININ